MTTVTEARLTYKNGYSVSETVKTAGHGYKILAGLTVLAGVGGGFMTGGGFGFAIFLGGLIAAAVLFGLGIIVQAIGETLAAILDTAAHTKVLVEGEGAPKS